VGISWAGTAKNWHVTQASYGQPGHRWPHYVNG